MDNLLAKHAKQKKLDDPILSVAKKAAQAKRINQNVINGTIGMLFDETGKLSTFNTVKTVLSTLTDKEHFGYAPTDGGPEFKESVLDWVLGESRSVLEENLHLSVVATPGGSGAISNVFSNYLNIGESILIPDIAWVYENFAKEFYLKAETFTLFNVQGQFAFDSLKLAVNRITKTQDRLVIVINDPCHNPTGFSLSNDEWDKFIDYVNHLAQTYSVVILHDIAYIDYDPRGYKATRDIFQKYIKLSSNAMAIIAFSGSKTFSMYGMRLGALIAISHNEDAVIGAYNASESSSRAKWSSTPHPSIAFLNRLMQNNEFKSQFLIELNHVSMDLVSRGELFISEAIEIGLSTYPYQGGFFVTLPVNDPQKVLEALVEEDIYLVSLSFGLRVSLSALSIKELKGLAIKIQNAIEKQLP